MICEYCSKEHDGSFATGRFCCIECSRGFSTKSKRKEINEKVSLKLKKPITKRSRFIKKKKTLEGSVEGQQTHLKCVADVTVEGSIPLPSLCTNCNAKEIKPGRKFCSNRCSVDYNKSLKNKDIELGLYSSKSPIRIKKYMLNKFGHSCMICKLSEWSGQKIPLVMDHIDGRSSNNRLENLRLVCANCDALLPTFKSKNKNSDRSWRRKDIEIDTGV